MAPRKGVYGIQSLKAFINSPTCAQITETLEIINDACKGQDLIAPSDASPIAMALCAGIEQVRSEALDTPLQTHAARFGNPAYRTFMAAVHAQSHELVLTMCAAWAGQDETEVKEEVIEDLKAYWDRSFGESKRLDYGTGHEAAFLFFICVLHRSGIMTSDSDILEMGLVVIPTYLSVVRCILDRFSLEPAGSHGVWSLDDYHFLPFILGSSQQNRASSDASYTRPQSLREVRIDDVPTDLFTEALQQISIAKTGTLSQHSPILYDILSIKSWDAINQGMLLLWKAEVLGKFPVAQHFVFGNVLRVTWEIVDQSEAEVKITPFNMAALQQSVVPGVNPQATDIVSKFFSRFSTSSGKGNGGGRGRGLNARGSTPHPAVNSPFVAAASAPGNVPHTLLENDRGIEIGGWEIESNVSRIASDAEWEEIVEMNPWAVLPPPEQLFAENFLRMKHKASGKEIRFDPIDALRGVLLPPKTASEEVKGQRKNPDRRLFKIVHAATWGERTDSFGHAIKQWRDDFDWTYTTSYQGTLRGGATRSRVGALDAGIDYNRLKRREPILWYKQVILNEDDLVDSGVSQLSVKARVMPSGWFVLCRCWVRVDGTFVRVFDTRFAHFFDDKPGRVLVEVSKKEASFEELKKAKKPAESMLLRDSNAVSEFLPSIEHYVDEILL